MESVRVIFVCNFEVACTFQFLQAVVDVEAGPGIGGGIEFLGFGQGVCFPVGEALCLGDFLSEQDAVYFLQAFVFDAEGTDVFLQLDAGVCFERDTLVQHHEVVFQRESYLGDVGAFEQVDDGQGESRQVEAEQEAVVFGRYLQQGHFVWFAFGEGGACFAVDAHHRALPQEGDRPFCLLRGLHHVNLSRERGFGQVFQCFFVNSSFYNHRRVD